MCYFYYAVGDNQTYTVQENGMSDQRLDHILQKLESSYNLKPNFNLHIFPALAIKAKLTLDYSIKVFLSIPLS